MSDNDNKPGPGTHLCGAFVVWPREGKQTVFAGMLDESPLPVGDDSSEIWMCEVEIVALRRFKVPKRVAGMRIDHLLCTKISPDELEPIE